MGRPPLQRAVRTVKTTVRFEEPVIARIAALVGDQGMAAFIRAATMDRLEREERALRSEQPQKKPRPA